MMSPFPFLENHQALLYALVDGALVDGFYTELARVDKLLYKSLFSGTIDANSAAVGPVILHLQPDIHKDLIQNLLILQTQFPTPIWLQTDITFTPLFNILRKLLYVEKEDGSQQFSRYYDQACLADFLSLVHKYPYIAYIRKKVNWAYWVKNNKNYQYYDKDKWVKAACEDAVIKEQLNSLSGVFIWVETKGTGHVFITVHKKGSIYLYTYGRYDDIDSFTFGATGEGVFIRYLDNIAVDYIRKELYRMDCKAYQIKDSNGDKAIALCEEMWHSSNERPDADKTSDRVKEHGRVIDDYYLSSNNCTTKACDILKESGSNIFKFKSLFLGYHVYNYDEYFILPSSLSNFLFEQQQTNPNIKESTDIMKSIYENVESIEELDKARPLAEGSGFFGEQSGHSANPSDTVNGRGISTATSAGGYGSSSN